MEFEKGIAKEIRLVLLEVKTEKKDLGIIEVKHKIG